MTQQRVAQVKGGVAEKRYHVHWPCIQVGVTVGSRTLHRSGQNKLLSRQKGLSRIQSEKQGHGEPQGEVRGRRGNLLS